MKHKLHTIDAEASRPLYRAESSKAIMWRSSFLLERLECRPGKPARKLPGSRIGLHPHGALIGELADSSRMDGMDHREGAYPSMF